MKILFYIESLRSGGKERRLVELIKGLRKNYPEIEMELVLTREDIHYTDIYETGIKIHYTVRKGLKKDPRLFWKFYKIAKKVKPDIIHVWGNMVAIYAIPAKVILGLPMINNQITEVPLVLANGLLNYKLPFKFSNILVSNSYAGLEAYNVPKNKGLCIYNGFNFDRLLHMEDPQIVKQKFRISTTYVIGMFATFSSYKDYDSYIAAAIEVLKKRKDVTFLSVGDGDSTKYASIIPDELNNFVLFLGRQSNVESIMNICDIGVLASFTEGISNSILEMMALGKPVIATGIGGTKEIIQHGINGYLLPAKNPEILADSILELLKNKDKREKFSFEARTTVKEKFNITKMIEAYFHEYKKLCVE